MPKTHAGSILTSRTHTTVRWRRLQDKGCPDLADDASMMDVEGKHHLFGIILSSSAFIRQRLT